MKVVTMIRFRRFEDEIAVFEINGTPTRLSKKAAQSLHDKNKLNCGKKGTCPDTEQTKFALDRWPGTDLDKRIDSKK